MSYINRPAKGTSWRKRAVNNLAGDVIIHEKIETSVPLAKSLTKLVARLITWAKQDNLAARRLALEHLVNKKHQGVLTKLFTTLKERYKNREGGYTRITKLFYRKGDNSLRVQLSLV